MEHDVARLERQMKEAIDRLPRPSYLWTHTHECFVDNIYLYHTTTSPTILRRIMAERVVRTGEFSTWPISGIGRIAIRFWKDRLFERGVRPVWYWGEPTPAGFVAYINQFTLPEECAWVKFGRDRSVNFDYSDVVSIVVWNRPGSLWSRLVRNNIRTLGIPVEVESGRSARALYVPRGTS